MNGYGRWVILAGLGVMLWLSAGRVTLATTAIWASEGVSMKVLANGVRLIAEETAENEVVAVTCLFNSGAASELDGQFGTTFLTLRMLLRGTKSMDFRTLTEAIESRGASLDAGCSEDYSWVTLVCLREDAPEMLELLREVIFEPAFDPEEFVKEKATIVAALRRAKDHPFTLAWQELRRDLYQGHPYSRSPQGEPDEVATYELFSLRPRWETVCRSELAVVSVVGNMTAADLAASFEKWPASTKSVPQVAGVSKSFAQSVFRVFEQDANQAQLLVGYVTPPMTQREHLALRLASAALGEGMSSRLFIALRDRDGLAYSVGSQCAPRFGPGHLLCHIGTAPENVQAALAGIGAQIEDLKKNILSDEELDRARQYVIGRFHLAQQTNLSRSRHRAIWSLAGLGYDYGDQYPALLRSISASEIRSAARNHLNRRAVLILGPAAIRDAMGRLPGQSLVP